MPLQAAHLRRCAARPTSLALALALGCLSCGPRPGASGTPPPVPPSAAATPPMVLNPDAPRDRIETRLRSDGDDRWVEWHTGYGPTGRQASLPINNPPVVHADAATHMKDDDPVIGVLVEEYARAYPWWFMTSGHLANDLIGGQPVLVTMCERCSGIAAFRSTLSGRMLDFRLAGIHNGTWFCADFQTGSFWHPFAGESWRGPLKGRKLERLRTYQSTWGKWKRDHPHTTVLLAGEEMRYRGHSRWEGVIAKHPGSPYMLEPAELRPKQPNPRREWLELETVIFALRGKEPGTGKAYPVERILAEGGLLQETYEGEPVALVARGRFQVGAYSRRLGDKVLELRIRSQEPFLLEDQRGTLWDEWGQAVAGPDDGEILSLLDGHLTEWYEWLYMAPDSELHGHAGTT